MIKYILNYVLNLKNNYQALFQSTLVKKTYLIPEKILSCQNESNSDEYTSNIEFKIIKFLMLQKCFYFLI